MEIPLPAIEHTIRRGVILHSDTFDWIDYGKFFVIAGVSRDHVAGFFFINSNIHPSIFSKQEQLDLQYPLKKADYSFLTHDSFLCASDIIKRPRHDIALGISSGSTAVIGEMKSSHICELLDMVRSSRLFSAKDKRDFFY